MMGPDWVDRGLRELQKQIEETFRGGSAALADSRKLARHGHRLVSQAGLLGFKELSDLGSRLEEACKGDPELKVIFKKAAAEARVAHLKAGELLGRSDHTRK